MSSVNALILLLSDFNIEPLAGQLANNQSIPLVEPVVGSYNQTSAILLNPKSEYWQNNPSCVVIWTQPQQVSISFQKLLDFESVNHDQVMAEVDEYASMIKSALTLSPLFILPLWTLPSYERGLGAADLKSGKGIANCLMRMNLRLTENFKDNQHVYFLNTQQIIERASSGGFNTKLWYMGKMIFGQEVLKIAAQEIKSIIRASHGISKKIILLDLDDTLWGGILGEDGLDHLRLGGHDPLGEAFVDFQKALLRLTRRGIVLGIISRNDEIAALSAIEQHPEMILRKKDFVGWRINWQDKAKNIESLLKELNLGLEAAIFIDDNPIERDRVRQALGGVLVPEWPADKMSYKEALCRLDCLDNLSLTSEDALRTQMYASERSRNELKKTAETFDDWLRSLKIKVMIEPLNTQNFARAVQLLNKTNQMNLSTRRLTEQEFLQWSQGDQRKVWTFRVSDKFGDNGLVGLASIEIKNQQAQLIDFLLSCRVFGRRIEESMLATAISYALSMNAAKLTATYVPSAKNKPCLEFLGQLNTFMHSGDEFTMDLKNEFSFPSGIESEMKESND